MTTYTVNLRDISEDLATRADEPEWDAAVASIVGLPAVYTTASGERLLGVVEPADRFSSNYPRIVFADGRWGRCDTTVELVA